MSVQDFIIWLTTSVPGIRSKGGYKVIPEGERGITYIDRTGMYQIDAYFAETGDRYGFRRTDIYKTNHNLPVERPLSERLMRIDDTKSKEIEKNVRDWLNSKGIANDNDEQREKRTEDQKRPKQS
jgi:hypothetical protein